MTKEEFINKYCKVEKDINQFMPESPWIKVVMDDCYLTSAVSIEDVINERDTIDMLLDFGITQVGSSFEKDEWHPNPVANIGYNPEQQKWYGWSYRAIHGFGIGDKSKEFYPDRTITGKEIETLEEAKEAAIKFADSVA